MTIFSLSQAHRAAEVSPGVILFTVSSIADGATSMARIYSSHPDVYPVGGRKSLDDQTDPAWLERVVRRGEPFLGIDVAAIRAFFFDADTIEALGCGSIINVPVRDHHETIGSINFLDRDGAYDDQSVESALRIAEQLVPAVRRAALTI